MPDEINDPDALRQLYNQRMLRQSGMEQGPDAITDPEALAQLKKQKANRDFLDVPEQLGRGAAKGLSQTLLDTATMPLQMLGRLWGRKHVEGADVATELAHRAAQSREPIVEGATPEERWPYQPTLPLGELQPRTRLGEYAGPIGEA